jgi:hypothetical protein
MSATWPKTSVLLAHATSNCRQRDGRAVTRAGLTRAWRPFLRQRQKQFHQKSGCGPNGDTDPTHLMKVIRDAHVDVFSRVGCFPAEKVTRYQNELPFCSVDPSSERGGPLGKDRFQPNPAWRGALLVKSPALFLLIHHKQ